MKEKNKDALVETRAENIRLLDKVVEDYEANCEKRTVVVEKIKVYPPDTAFFHGSDGFKYADGLYSANDFRVGDTVKLECLPHDKDEWTPVRILAVHRKN